MNKLIISKVKIQIPSQEANPSPPIGPVLGQKGINIMNFCKEFNLKTINIEKGLIIPVLITIYKDKSFSFILKNPPTSILIKKKLNISIGSKNPGVNIINYINLEDIKDIALIKINDFNTNNLDSIIKSIIGTAKSMGVKLKE